MKFTHHPRKPEGWSFDPSVTYKQSEKGGWKPHGFWLSVDDGWREFCRDSEWTWPTSNPAEFDVDLERVFVISSLEEFDAFNAGYVADNLTGLGYGLIDWTALSREYSGIIIAPYQWPRRMSEKACWYYPWDCASGCFWDLSVVREKVAA